MDLKEETRCGYKISPTMKKVWSIQMAMAQKLIDVCNKNGLRVWAEGGTLLGTIRHHGYIPWDDDIDMVMLREDYDKLVAIGAKEFKTPFFFQCAYTDKLYQHGHAQLRYSGTTCFSPAEFNCKYNKGIFIDIFVYDSIPKDKGLFINRMLKAELIRAMMRNRVYGKVTRNNLLGSIKHVLSLAFFAIYNFRKAYRKFESLYAGREDADKSNDISCPTFSPALTYTIHRRREWYEETIYMPFEDIVMPVPAGYDKILTDQYGDYMTPTKAPTYHGSMIIDPEHSYKDIIAKIKKGKVKMADLMA